MTDNRHEFAGFIEIGNEPMKPLIVDHRHHRRLAAGDKEDIISGWVNVAQTWRILQQRDMARRGQKAPTNQIVGRIAARVTRVTVAIDDQSTTVGAGNRYLIAMFHKFPIGMGQLGGPHPNRPTGSRGNGPIGRHHEDTFRLVGVHRINRCTHQLAPCILHACT